MRVKDLCMGCMKEKGRNKVCPFCGWNETTPAASPLHLKPGSILADRYIIGKALGQGASGITYIAYDIIQNDPLAIKEYLPAGLASRIPGQQTIASSNEPQLRKAFRDGLMRFFEEAEALQAFTGDPGVVTVRGCVDANGTAYLAMDFIKGRTLHEHLNDPPQLLNYQDTMKIMIPVLGALSRIHRVGLLHRDVRPENIMIGEDGKVRLIGFGSARYIAGEQSKNLAAILTCGYAACEQHYSLAAQGTWTDVYAAAATIYRAMAGQAPPDCLVRVHKDDLMSPARLGIEMPDYAEAALLKALSVKANERYHRISEFANDLRRPRQAEEENLDATLTEVEEQSVAEPESPGQTLKPEVQPGSDMEPPASMIQERDPETEMAYQPPRLTPDMPAPSLVPAESVSDPKPGQPSDSPKKIRPILDWSLNRKIVAIFVIIMLVGFLVGIIFAVIRAYVAPPVQEPPSNQTPASSESRS